MDDMPSTARHDMMKSMWNNKANMARCGALALFSCSRSKRNRMTARIAGVMPLLARQLLSTDEEILVPIVGTLKEFAREASVIIISSLMFNVMRIQYVKDHTLLPH